MMNQVSQTGLVALVVASLSQGADLSKIERRIAKEPTYASKAPQYALLVLGLEAKDRVWLVKDGDALYVDRNGNGDLTDAGERLLPKKPRQGMQEDERSYELDSLTLGGRKHENLRVSITPLKRWLVQEYASRPDMQAAFKKNPKAEVLLVTLDVEAPHIKANGTVRTMAGTLDPDGPLVWADRSDEAPIVHLAGPLGVVFASTRPTIRRGRSTEFMLVVGSPGKGPGTYSAVAYQDVLPEEVRPVAEITFAPGRAGGEPVKKRFEFKDRC